MREPASTDVPCPHVVRLPVLGVETTFATNEPEVLERVREAWGRWATLRETPGVVSPSAAVVRVVVEAGADPDRTARSPVPDVRPWPRPHVVDPTTLRIDGPGGSGTADTSRLESRARVVPEILTRPGELVGGWLEPLTLFLLGALDRQPLHAAAVLYHPGFAGGVGDGRGDVAGDAARAGETPGEAPAILLAGPSGAGKSTLTYAAWRSGRFSVLADEPVYVQLGPRFRVWGRGARLHLSPDARGHFPELDGVAPTRLRTGKAKIVVEAGGDTPPYAERAAVCLLARSAGRRPTLESVPPERAVAELTARLDPGYDLFADTIGERIRRVAEGGAWRLRLTDDPGAALPLLEEVAEQVGGAG